MMWPVTPCGSRHVSTVMPVWYGIVSPCNLSDAPRVELEVARARGDVGARLSERLAGGARFELCQSLAYAFDCGGQLHQQPSALGRRQAAPVAVAEFTERGTRGIDRTADVGSIAAGDARECCANRRIERVDRLAVVRRQPAIADEVLCTRTDFAIQRSVHARSSAASMRRLFQQGRGCGSALLCRIDQCITGNPL